jgi:hypothetical protein
MSITVEQAVDSAINNLALTEDFYCKKCSVEEAEQVIITAKSLYVNGNPRVWWLCLNKENVTYNVYVESVDYEVFGLEVLHQYGVVNNEIVWFIPETDEPDFPSLPVYETTLDSILKVLGECNFFESYILAKNFSWICIENDHNETIIGQLKQISTV